MVRARPLLCAYHAIVLLASNQIAAAEARLLDADQALQSATAAEVSDLTPGWVALAHSGICSYTGDLVGSIAFAQQALDLLPATAVHVRASATMNTTLTYLLHGDVTPAMERRVRAAITPARASGNPFVFLRSISNLARLQVLQGQLHQAATTYAQAVQIAPEQAGLRVRISGAAYYCGFGDLMREWNDLEAADYLLTEGTQDHRRDPINRCRCRYPGLYRPGAAPAGAWGRMHRRSRRWMQACGWLSSGISPRS